MGQVGVNNGSTPLGALIAAERQRRGWTRSNLAERVRRAALRDGVDLETSGETIKGWELRGHRPQAPALRALSVVLERPVEELTALAGQQPAETKLGGLELLPPVAPADADYIDAVRASIGHLVGLEVQHGGDAVASLAIRYFESVRRRLAAGGHPRHLDRDLTATAGELAEVAAWLAHDADDQAGARKLNMEALYLSRLAGDRSIELLTMSNMAFMALFQRHAGEALILARALRDDHLTNRLRVIFELREARALAQLGAGAEGIRIAEQAQSAFWDGATSDDPGWAWWIDAPEITGHLAGIYHEAGHTQQAISLLQSGVETCPPQQLNNQFFRLARLLSATVEAGAWSDAEGVINRTLPHLGDVRSGRAVRVLREAIAGIGPDAQPRLVEAGHHLDTVLTAVGYLD